MATYASLDRGLTAAVNALHDHLWVAPAKDEAALLRRLEAHAAALDRHLGTRGLVRGAVRPVTRAFRKHPGGKDVFEFLHTVGHLAAAVEYRTRRPKEAAKRAAEVVGSHAIGLAAQADHFDLVEAYQAGKTTFLEFTTALADVLEQKGVVLAGEFKRAANATFDVNAIWDEAWSKDAQVVAATSAIGSAAFATFVHVEALRALGGYHEAPYGRLVPAVRRILDRMGAHA